MILSINRLMLFSICLFFSACIQCTSMSHTVNSKGSKMEISVSLHKQNIIIDTVNKIPVIPLGSDIKILGVFKNPSADTITMEDPETSQRITVQCGVEGENETTFLLHPSTVDNTGEVTCLPVSAITLKNSENRQVDVSLYKHIMDKVFSPGLYLVSLSYDSIRSAPCLFNISFKEESVSQLIAILDDTTKNIWVRKESFLWLKKLDKNFQYDFTSHDNKKNSAQFKLWWEKNKNTAEVKSAFSQ
jgi:hypothetical protein